MKTADKLLVTIITTLVILSFKGFRDADFIPAKENEKGGNGRKSGYIPVNGISMYYEIYSEGKPLVLIHFEGMKQATINDMPQSLRSAFLQINPDSSRLITMFNKDKERMLRFNDWSEEVISSIKAPSLIICGDHDVVKSAHAVAISKLIKNSRLMILPATHGSYMVVVESPGPDMKIVEMTLNIIEDFLTNDQAFN